MEVQFATLREKLDDVGSSKSIQIHTDNKWDNYDQQARVTKVLVRLMLEMKLDLHSTESMQTQFFQTAIQTVDQDVSNDLSTANKLEMIESFLGNFQYQTVTECAKISSSLCQEIYKSGGRGEPMSDMVVMDFYSHLFREFPTMKKLSGYHSFLKSMQSLNLFVLGAGALGNEYMMLLSALNAGIKGQIFIMDNDTIETSNLCRQFFFRKHHCGRHKAEVVAEQLSKINSNYEIGKNLVFKCCKLDRESILDFSDEFWLQQNYCLLGVDNVQARLFFDKAVNYKFSIITFEAGTLGEEGNVQSLIPKLTRRYQDQEGRSELTDQKPEKNNNVIVNCTDKGIPTKSQDCLVRAKTYFEYIFIAPVKRLLLELERKQC